MDQKKCWWKALLKAKEEQNSVSHVLSIDNKDATKKGDNYAGVLKRVTIELLLKSGKKTKKSVIIKSPPPSTLQKEMNAKLGMSKKEILMYRDILPYMEDLMREHNCTEFMWCSCLHFIPYHTLYLEDLSVEGYIMKDRKYSLDLEHCLLVVRSMAIFHATSVALVERDLICLEMFREHIFQNKICQQMNESFLKDAYKQLADLVDTWKPEWKQIAEKLRNISPDCIEMLLDLYNTDKSKFNVLCHGDCWVNNIMFKNGVDGVTPISVKFVDFQTPFYNSPAFDLQYFIGSSADLEVRKNSIPKLLETYHSTLCKQLELYKYEGNIISLDELKAEMDRLDLFGLNTAMQMLPAMFMEKPEEIPDLEEHFKKLAETNEVDKESWKEYFTIFHSSPRYRNFMIATFERIIENNSLFAGIIF